VDKHKKNEIQNNVFNINIVINFKFNRIGIGLCEGWPRIDLYHKKENKYRYIFTIILNTKLSCLFVHFHI